MYMLCLGFCALNKNDIFRPKKNPFVINYKLNSGRDKQNSKDNGYFKH